MKTNRKPLASITVADHEAAQDKCGFSYWTINKPRKLRIRVQKFKGRLYLVGQVFIGISLVYPFECPIGTLHRVPGIEFTAVKTKNGKIR